jgi:hypothetical protein
VVTAGSYVLVTLVVETSDPRYFVAIDDPLSAGLEPSSWDATRFLVKWSPAARIAQ